MEDSEIWAVVHSYFSLAKENKVHPLTCSCGSEFVRGLGEDDRPVFRCLSCKVKSYPTITLLETMKKGVEAHK